MTNVIGASVVALVALSLLVDRLRRRTQRLGKAVEQVHRELAKLRPGSETALVAVWSAHPLSDHMIKELATARGYRCVGERMTYNGARGLEFKPPQQRRKLSLDV
ncbi:hypothetical protein AB0878_14280 [Amycolatopsis sp. NPDC047767]|uniref:hypothetical protein n=1 Tax=Amycolatopsis sp. NPDC047767 TaxID=3156765 RepID=UPI003454550E